jgi:hypothetical protein
VVKVSRSLTFLKKLKGAKISANGGALAFFFGALGAHACVSSPYLDLACGEASQG